MLKQTTDRKMFMTFLVVVFDMQEKTLTLASAGHPPMLHCKPQGGSLVEVRQIALPLGGIMGAKYTEQTLSFETGDLFVFYTDGLIEARNAAGDEFGLKRLMRKIKPLAARTENAEKIRETLMTDAQLFIGEQIQEDDITLVVVKAKENEVQSERPEEKSRESQEPIPVSEVN
jgi:sigma-B regulation protein RsbU (phosphoserine phosphatase)